jgi:phage protein D
MVRQSPQANPNSGYDIDPSYYKYKIGLKLDGAKIPESMLANVREVKIEESLYKASKFTITIDNPFGPGHEEGIPGEYTDQFKPWQRWEIALSGSRAEPSIFQPPYAGRVIHGYCTRVEGDFNIRTQGPIKITGYDRTYLFHEGIHNRTFLNMKHSEIVRKLAKDVGLTNVEIEDTGFVDEYVIENGTNIEFIRKLAALNGFEFFIQCGNKDGVEKLYFRRPPKKGKPDLVLTWGENIRSIKPRYIKLPIDFIEIPFWDYKQKERKQTRKNRQAGFTNTKTLWDADAPSVNGTAKLHVSGSWHTNSLEKTERVAQSLCDEFQGQFMCADVEAEGNAEIRPGTCIGLPKEQKGEIGNFVGNYYVTETCHTYKNGILTTYFTVSDNGGLSLLANNLSTENRLKPGQTNLVGIVTDNKDPDNMGRVKVKFPNLEDRESYWARMVMPGAGKGRGFDCLPEVNDEVMVAFEHGDIHRPYIVGGVWNGKDEPPEHVNDSVKDGKVRLRTFKSRVGHEMQFVDENGSKRNKGIYFKTAGGHKFEMDDQEKRILLKTSGGLTIEMNDKSKMIEIKVPGGGNIKLDMKGVSINGL